MAPYFLLREDFQGRIKLHDYYGDGGTTSTILALLEGSASPSGSHAFILSVDFQNVF